MTSAAFEERLQALECQLLHKHDASPADVVPRLDALEQRFYDNDTTATFRELWKESEKLIEELDPGTALSHQQQIVAPIVYRKQEILACADDLKGDFKRVAEILNLLSIGQADQIKNESVISEQRIAQAPILMTLSMPEEQRERLQQTSRRLLALKSRADEAASKLDRLLDNYHAIASAVSEKIVLADEQIQFFAQQGK